eukprot:9058485-Pyramimonas_sp.AAC.1
MLAQLGHQDFQIVQRTARVHACMNKLGNYVSKTSDALPSNWLHGGNHVALYAACTRPAVHAPGRVPDAADALTWQRDWDVGPCSQ